jgi:hypothetical protein
MLTEKQASPPFPVCPYIPEAGITHMVVSGELPVPMKEELIKRGIGLIETRGLNSLAVPLSYHPDMQLLHVTHDTIICAPNLDEEFKTNLRDRGLTVIPGLSEPSAVYPGDIPYNTVLIGEYAILNVRHTDPVVIEWLEKTGKKLIHVNQGYSKCSVAIVNREAAITSDRGISKALNAVKLDVLLIEPCTDILLPGYNFGFIGGACGLISESDLVFSGNFHRLRQAEVICEFLRKHGIKAVSLGDGSVVDTGGFIPLGTV